MVNKIKFFLDLHYYVEVKKQNFAIGSDEWLANWRIIYFHLFLFVSSLFLSASLLPFEIIEKISRYLLFAFPLYGYFLSTLISKPLYKIENSYFKLISIGLEADYARKASMIYWLFVLYETIIFAISIALISLSVNYA